MPLQFWQVLNPFHPPYHCVNINHFESPSKATNIPNPSAHLATNGHRPKVLCAASWIGGKGGGADRRATTASYYFREATYPIGQLSVGEQNPDSLVSSTLLLCDFHIK